MNKIVSVVHIMDTKYDKSNKREQTKVTSMFDINDFNSLSIVYMYIDI